MPPTCPSQAGVCMAPLAAGRATGLDGEALVGGGMGQKELWGLSSTSVHAELFWSSEMVGD